MAEEQEVEKTYEVKDKRRVTADGELRQTEEPEKAAPQAGSEQATAEGTQSQEPDRQEELPEPSVYDVLQFVAGMIAEQAWYHLGVRLAPGQKEPKKDLVQARIAIDTVAYISEQLEPHIEENVRKALKATISDLKINFVRQSQ